MGLAYFALLPLVLLLLLAAAAAAASFLMPALSSSRPGRRPTSFRHQRRGAHADVIVRAGAVAGGDEGKDVLTIEERSLLLNEIEDLTRSFESVQRTIRINGEVYEERVRDLMSRLKDVEKERNELLEDKVESMRELVVLKAEKNRYEETIASLEFRANELERERDGMRDTLEKVQNDGSGANGQADEMIRNRLSFASEKARMQADFGSILREKDAAMNELQQKIETYEKERSSLRKLTALGLKRFASLFRLRRTKD